MFAAVISPRDDEALIFVILIWHHRQVGQLGESGAGDVEIFLTSSRLRAGGAGEGEGEGEACLFEEETYRNDQN